MAAELADLCRWHYMWVTAAEVPAMHGYHLTHHLEAREQVLRRMEVGSPEEQAYAAEARAWIASGGDWPI